MNTLEALKAEREVLRKRLRIVQDEINALTGYSHKGPTKKEMRAIARREAREKNRAASDDRKLSILKMFRSGQRKVDIAREIGVTASRVSQLISAGEWVERMRQWEKDEDEAHEANDGQ